MFPGLGWHNPLPADVGGGPTDTEDMYLQLRAAVGDGGAGPVDGIEDLWRQCKAAALAASAAANERATLQKFPGLSTDLLPAYERMLGIAPASSLVERQQAVEAAWTLALSATIPNIAAELLTIDPALQVQLVDYNQATIVQFGKQFASRTGTPPYGSGQTATVFSSAWPNYSTNFVLLVRYTLSGGQTKIPAVTRDLVKRYLNEVLSSWVDWTLFTGTPFYLDGGADGTSLLDQTAFG